MRLESSDKAFKRLIGIVLIGFACILYFHFARSSAKTPVPIQKTSLREPVGRIALIIDDWGYNVDHCAYLSNIKSPITVSVLPSLTYSSKIAYCAHQTGHQVMLHLPLEPHLYHETYPKDYILTTDMDERTIEGVINKAMANIPHIVGVNNHMGSKATEDREFMKKLLVVLNRKGLFFVDSRATKDTISKEMARRVKIPFGERDVFLDNREDRSYIEGQFALLAKEAKEKGSAIGIGHDRSLTLKIIAEQTKRLQKDGFEFVTVQQLLKSQP